VLTFAIVSFKNFGSGLMPLDPYFCLRLILELLYGLPAKGLRLNAFLTVRNACIVDRKILNSLIISSRSTSSMWSADSDYNDS